MCRNGAATAKKQAAIEKRQSKDLAAQTRKSVEEAKVKTLADEKQKRLEDHETACTQALQYYEKCSDQDLRRGFCALNRGEDTKIKRNQLVANLANSFTEHDRGLLFRPKNGALVKVKHFPSVDATCAFVFTKVDSTGKTVKPPEEGYNVNLAPSAECRQGLLVLLLASSHRG